MFEVIMYNIGKSIWLFAIFAILIILFGTILYMIIRKFDIHKKRTMFAGMFSKLSKKQLILLSSIIIKTYLIVFCSVYYSSSILIYLLMIILTDIVYIVFNIKKSVFEIINTIAQLTLLYIINILTNYRLEIANEKFVLQIQIVLSVFIIMYAIYFLFKNFEEIISNRKELV